MSKKQETINDDAYKALEHIAGSFNMPIEIGLTRPCSPVGSMRPTVVIFVNAGSQVMFGNDELLHCGIHNKKDYRKLRELVRVKLCSAAQDLKRLAEDTIRNLGYEQRQKIRSTDLSTEG